LEVSTLESGAPTDYVNNLTQLAQAGYSPVFAVRFPMTDDVNEVAPQFPTTQFVLIDSVAEGPNVVNLVFREHEASYLAGIVAGLMTQPQTQYTTPDRHIVGWVGGMD